MNLHMLPRVRRSRHSLSAASLHLCPTTAGLAGRAEVPEVYRWAVRLSGVMRTVIAIVATIVVCCAAGCTQTSSAPPPTNPSASTAPSPAVVPPGTTSLDCSDPIDIVPSPTTPRSSTLDVVGLDTVSTLQVSNTGGTDPHQLFAKTGLLVHAGRASTVTVPADWATHVSIAWGNHAAEWTTSLHIPACPEPPSGSGQWLAFPGGFSVDRATCVPLEVHAGTKTTTIHISVGARCRG
jgi:hypothetical protein